MSQTSYREGPDGSAPAVSLDEAAKAAGALDRRWLGDQVIHRPRQPPRPVDVVDNGGRVDAIAPAEDVLDGQQEHVGSGGENRRDDRVAHGVGERLVGAT